jgi:pimeloyl-ACP methyl ester carboxylesterase
MMDRMLPEKGPWPHPYYAIDDSFVEVAFTDAEGHERRVNVRQKKTGDGPPMVLVHGLMTSSYSWRFVLEPLGRRYRVHAPDLVGAGGSDKPLDMTYSVENVARFIVAYIRAVAKEPVYLIGNSLGGLYALRALMIGGATSLATRYLLMHAPGYPILRTRLLRTLFDAPALGSGLAALVAKVSHRFPEEFVRRNVHYARKDIMSREECIEYGRLFETLDGARVFARILAESLDPAEHVRIIEELRRTPLGIPVRLLYARKDVMVPPSIGPKFHADMPGSELVWMDDASHFLHVDAPERTVEQIIGFDR